MKPNTDVLMKLIREHFGPELQLACTHKRWKDGIDIDFPTYAIEAFTEAIIVHADELKR